jgi:hypothetical protein
MRRLDSANIGQTNAGLFTETSIDLLNGPCAPTRPRAYAAKRRGDGQRGRPSARAVQCYADFRHFHAVSAHFPQKQACFHHFNLFGEDKLHPSDNPSSPALTTIPLLYVGSN